MLLVQPTQELLQTKDIRFLRKSFPKSKSTFKSCFCPSKFLASCPASSSVFLFHRLKIAKSERCGCILRESINDKNAATEYALSDCHSVEKSIDVVTLSNLCVDIVLNVAKLPPESLEERYCYMRELAASNPDKRFWEAGGNSNFAIAAARLGLNCLALGEIGDDKYGLFLCDVLKSEGVSIVGIGEDNEWQWRNRDDTVLCWVLVDPERRHGFCSRFDFNESPAFGWIRKLSGKAERVIQKSKVLFLNGFAFDELSPTLISSILDVAKNAKTSIFFDPGPRNKALLDGTPEQQKALRKILAMSEVLLLTDDEAKSLTGKTNPISAAQALLKEGLLARWVIIKMGSSGSIVATSKGLFYAPAFKVDVADTVGCGDSFAAAIVIGYIKSLPLMTTLLLANAVGGATAMGCGAGRNVATAESVCDLLSKAESHNEYSKCLRKWHPEDYYRNTDIVLTGNLTDSQNYFSLVEFQAVAKDALNSILKTLKVQAYVSRCV